MAVIADIIGTLRNTFRINRATFDAAGLTAARTFTLPDAAGTLALTTSRGVNALINGALDIWQRGTSFAAAASGTYSADRWGYAKTGAMVHTIAQSTDVPTVAQAGRLFSYSLKATLTTADTSIAADDYCLLIQSIEGWSFLPLAQRPTTLSFWVKAGLTGIYCASLRNSVSDRSIVVEFTVSSANTWEKKTINFAASPSGGTWNYTNGIGATLTIILACGSSFQTTAGAWQTGNFIATANQINGVNTGAGDFLLTGLQLEAGTVATEIEARPFATEFALCQRYHTIIAGIFTTDGASGAYQAWSMLPTAMRAVPTITTSDSVGTGGSFVALGSTGIRQDANNSLFSGVTIHCAAEL